MRHYLPLTLPVLMLASVSFAGSSRAAEGWHVGFTTGSSHTRPDIGQFDDGSIFAVDADYSTVLAFSLFGEFRFSPYLGLELGHISNGWWGHEAQSSGGSAWRTGDISIDYKVNNTRVGALGTLPLDRRQRLNLLAKVGLSRWTSKVELSDNFGIVANETDQGIAPYTGIGVEYSLLSRLGIRLQLEHYRVRPESKTFNQDYNFDYNSLGFAVFTRF
ncbi:MAG: porin family protein [Gammaproteobacteria bacterium]|nr:porin family protein [Gammaproteobacteria bacterium]